MEREEALYYAWKGTIDRNPEYFSTVPDLIINGVPRFLWGALAVVCPSVQEALA